HGCVKARPAEAPQVGGIRPSGAGRQRLGRRSPGSRQGLPGAQAVRKLAGVRRPRVVAVAEIPDTVGIDYPDRDRAVAVPVPHTRPPARPAVGKLAGVGNTRAALVPEIPNPRTGIKHADAAMPGVVPVPDHWDPARGAALKDARIRWPAAGLV